LAKYFKNHWCRRGESNPLPTLKSRKLQILLNAKNVETARNVFHGYAAVTRRLRGGYAAVTRRLRETLSAGGTASTKKKTFPIRTPTKRSTGLLLGTGIRPWLSEIVNLDKCSADSLRAGLSALPLSSMSGRRILHRIVGLR
jgi:hypothetical protein